MKPAVSVVIPTYNRATLVGNAIESALQQTWKDYEIIVIDDGSTDDTKAKLQPYMQRIRYFYQPNQGASAAQNAGVRLAEGKWISILASDDTWSPTKLERQLSAVAELGSEFGACFTDCSIIQDGPSNITAFGEAGLTPKSVVSPLENPIKYIVGGRFGLYVQSMLVLRSLMTEVGGFDESLGVAEDVDLIFRLSWRTKFCLVSLPLVSVDRTSGCPRLMDLVRSREDQTYAWNERRLHKMLLQADSLDPEDRQALHEELLDVCYSWTAAKVTRLEAANTLKVARKLRGLGESYPRIIATLLSRAGRKAGRLLALRGEKP